MQVEQHIRPEPRVGTRRLFTECFVIRVGLTNTTGSFPHFVRFWDFSALGARDLALTLPARGLRCLGPSLHQWKEDVL